MSYIFEDAPGTGGYAPVTADQLKGALANSGLDTQTQQSIFNTILPPAPAPSSSSPSGPSSAPLDWQSIINNDPFLRQTEADSAAASAEDAANRKVAIDKALAQWGDVPDFASAAGSLGLNPSTLGFLNSDVDQATKDLAAKNTKEGLSIFARLQKQNQDNIRQIKRALAARGMAASGETGYQLGEEGLRYKQDLTDNEQKMLDYITGVVAAFTQGERGRLRDLAQAKMDAADRAIGLYGNTMGGGSGGSGGSSGGGGGGLPAGVDPNDFIYGSTIPAGQDVSTLWQAAAAGAPAGAVPMHVMSQGMVQNGQISVKYRMPDGTTNTIWVPLVTNTAQQAAQSGGGGSSSGGGGGGGGSSVSSGGVSYSNPFGLSII